MNKSTKTLLGVLLLALMTPSLASALDLSKTKAKGDLRLRYEQKEIDEANSEAKNRFRFRYRLKLEQEVNDKTDVILGLASGGSSASSARSTNQTFDSNSSSKGLAIDLAYVKYRPSGSLTLQAGKMKNPIWTPTDMLWDSDINPEGVSIQKELDSGENFLTSILVGHFILEERSTSPTTDKEANDDTTVTVIQPKAEIAISDSIEMTGALSYYTFSNVQNQAPLAGSASADDRGNSLTADDTVAQKFAPIVLSSTLTFNDTPSVEMIQFFAEYVQNGDAEKVTTPGGNSEENSKGYILGVKFGDKKIKASKDWQFKVSYRDLENDAWLDSLPNADAYSGSTGIKGLNAGVKVGLAKNTALGISYYTMEQRKDLAASSKDDQTIQVDLGLKF